MSSLSMIGETGLGSTDSLPAAPTSEATSFVARFEREYGSSHLGFALDGFTEPLRRSRREGRPLFVCLHRSPESRDTMAFYRQTLGSGDFSAFINKNFVAGTTKGLKTSKSFRTSQFPFVQWLTPLLIIGSLYYKWIIDCPPSQRNLMLPQPTIHFPKID